MATVETERPFAPPLPALSPRAELALLARLLHVEGYDDHLSGHISYKQGDGSLLVNPFGLTWDEIRPSDVMRISPDGDILDGPWTVTPAIELHLALHRARPDVVVGVHNHSRWGTIWADLQRVPPVYDQTSAMVDGEIALFDAYDGDVGRLHRRAGRRLLGVVAGPDEPRARAHRLRPRGAGRVRAPLRHAGRRRRGRPRHRPVRRRAGDRRTGWPGVAVRPRGGGTRPVVPLSSAGPDT